MKLKYIFLFSLLKALRAGFKAQAPFQVSSFKFSLFTFHFSLFTFNVTPVHAQRILS